MTALDDLGAWLTGRDVATAAAAFTQGAGSRQAEVDAGIKTTADLNASLVALQAKFDAYVKAHPDVPVPPPTTIPKVVEFRDFAQAATSGLSSPATGLLGAGVTATTYRMAPKTSTKSAPTAADSTNENYLMRFGAMGGAGPSGLDIGGFTLQGTDQGHLYNGLQVGWSTGAKVHDLLITGIPGASSSPPGETFSFEGWHSTGLRVSNVKIDARDSNGKAVGASLFACSSVNDAVFENITANYTTTGFGLTLWDSSNIVVRNADLRFNRRAINSEQAHPGVMQFINCDMRGQVDTSNPHMTCSGTRGSTKYVITDPIVDKWPLRVGVAPTYNGAASTQKVSDVQLIVGGKDVTADPKYLICGAVWGQGS